MELFFGLTKDNPFFYCYSIGVFWANEENNRYCTHTHDDDDDNDT